MKLRILLSLLFVITTSFTAFHELEHINQDHLESSCEVCIVDNNTISADILTRCKYVEFTHNGDISSSVVVFNLQSTVKHYRSRAPPIIS